MNRRQRGPINATQYDRHTDMHKENETKRDMARSDARQLGVLLAAAGTIGFFIEPATTYSIVAAAIGIVIWLFAIQL